MGMTITCFFLSSGSLRKESDVLESIRMILNEDSELAI